MSDSRLKTENGGDASTTDASTPRVPFEEYGEHYFKSYNYADRPLSRFSMYWFARRYYAALVRRYAPPGGGKLLEMGCGLGHLIGLLQDDFHCVGFDLAEYAVEQTHLNAPRAEAFVHSADDLSAFEDGEFSVVIALHLVEHLADPQAAIRHVHRILRPGGLFLYATPNPTYKLRRFKDPATDAIGKDPTHINVQLPVQWRTWTEAAGFRVLRHFGDGLWDVPYLKGVPVQLQFAVFGLPALLQVVTQTSFTPVAWGVNQIMIARKTAEAQS
jgi:SAM-dependent methyltransferase